MKILIIGLGNPILGDDGIGWVVAERVKAMLDTPQPATANPHSVEVDCVALGGLSLMERLTGSDFVVIIDAIHTGAKPVGTVSLFPLTDLPDLSSGHTTAVHDTSLRNALNVGRGMDIPLPIDENIMIVAVEADAVYDFSDKLSASVEASVPTAAETVLKIINQR